MTNIPEIDRPGDAELTALLDGELAEPARSALERTIASDPGLAARLELLRRGGRDFRPALDLVLDGAPMERLEAMLALRPGRPSAPRAGWASRRRFVAIAAALVLFVTGGVIGVLLPRVVPALAPEPVWNWRTTVAEYVSLYTTETFAGIPDDPAARARQLGAVGGKLGLDLDPQKVALPGMAMKGAIIFAYRDKPLAQISYLSDDGPVALCIYNNGRADDAPPRFEQREGLNIVFWQKGGRGFLVIGKTPQDRLEAFAAGLSQRVS